VESVLAYMENTANLGLFVVHKVVSEYAERIYAPIEKSPRYTKLGISYLIMVRHEKYFRSLLSTQNGLD
jgi:hypothetical protein